MILEELYLFDSYRIETQKTKESIKIYMKDIDDIMIKATHYFKEHTEQLHSHKIKQYQF